ncbi:hypothetical protein Tco_0962367 [Tanacetum coccineum]
MKWRKFVQVVPSSGIEERENDDVISIFGFDVESLAKLMVNENPTVTEPYSVQKGQNMTKLLQMKMMELELKVEELAIQRMEQRQKDEALYLSTTDQELKAGGFIDVGEK